MNITDIVQNEDFLEVVEEKIIERKIKCDVKKLKPGFYEVREGVTTRTDKSALFSFVITNWYYGGPNYIIVKEKWQGPVDQGTCMVDTVVTNRKGINTKLEELLTDTNLKLFKI